MREMASCPSNGAGSLVWVFSGPKYQTRADPGQTRGSYPRFIDEGKWRWKALSQVPKQC